MTLEITEAIHKAVSTHDAAAAGRIADRLRFNFGMNYDQIRVAFADASGISGHEFELLMYYADEADRWEQ